MFGVYYGGRRVGESEDSCHVLCCDASKGNREIMINSCNYVHMKKIRYSADGLIYTYPQDAVLETDINEVLHLNGEDGTDTSTRVIKGRREAYRSYVRFVKGRKTSKQSRRMIESKIRQIEEQDIYDEFAGVKLYFLKKKLRQL